MKILLLGRYEQDFIEERRRQLEIWLNRVCQHPVLCASFPVQHFVTCELTDSSNKVRMRKKREEIIQHKFLIHRIGNKENEKLKKMNYVKQHGFIVSVSPIQIYLILKCINIQFIFRNHFCF